MKVECKISAEYKEPYAVLHINKMTDSVAEIISMLEKENANSLTLIAKKDKNTYFIKPEDISVVRTEGREIVCYDKRKTDIYWISHYTNWRTCLPFILCAFPNQRLSISIKSVMWKQASMEPWDW